MEVNKEVVVKTVDPETQQLDVGAALALAFIEQGKKDTRKKTQESLDS